MWRTFCANTEQSWRVEKLLGLDYFPVKEHKHGYSALQYIDYNLNRILYFRNVRPKRIIIIIFKAPSPSHFICIHFGWEESFRLVLSANRKNNQNQWWEWFERFVHTLSSYIIAMIPESSARVCNRIHLFKSGREIQIQAIER